jgi:hypothetical protein
MSGRRRSTAATPPTSTTCSSTRTAFRSRSPLTGGHRHDVTQLLPLLEAVPPIRGRRGRPRRTPRELFVDRGYDFDKYRRLLRARGITHASPAAAKRTAPGWARCAGSSKRGFAWLHACKRLHTRYERRGDIHLGLLTTVSSARHCETSS